MSRERVQLALVYGGAVLLSMSTISRYAEGGRPYFGRSLTVMDHAGLREHETRQVLLLLPKVAPLLPRGATVTCFRPRNGEAWNDDAIYLTAVGLLPRQIVVPPFAAAANLSGHDLAEYVVAVGGRFDHPGYEPVAVFPNGWLYKRR